jgi:hypothetical protein
VVSLHFLFRLIGIKLLIKISGVFYTASKVNLKVRNHLNPKLGNKVNPEVGNQMNLYPENDVNFLTIYLGNHLVADMLLIISDNSIITTFFYGTFDPYFYSIKQKGKLFLDLALTSWKIMRSQNRGFR